MNDFNLKVLYVFADMDARDMLFWRVDDDEVRFFAIVNDVFHWGCSDLEQITPENIEVCEQAIKDIEAIDSQYLYCAVELFAARVRRMRPQGAYYAHFPSSLHGLFDACGPKREVELGNPIAHPSDK